MSPKAKESPQIERARKKIEKQIVAADKRINPEALQMMRKLIEQQLSRHFTERINLKKRHITLFDENRHPAKTQSKFVANLLHQIKEGKSKKSKGKLAGRISTI